MNPNTDVQTKVPSKNSQIAKHGFHAEVALCLQEDVKNAMEMYFQSPIQTITRIHGKKYDLRLKFENGSETTLQNKDGNGKGRGWSVDRRKVERFEDNELILLLKTLCLKQGTEKPSVPNTISKRVLQLGMLGLDEKEYPTYFTHTISNKGNGKIISMSICHTDVLMDFMHDKLYETMVPKRTCVHLSPNCYLQRKGSKKDTRADDIQMKFCFTQELDKLFIPILGQPIPQ